MTERARETTTTPRDERDDAWIDRYESETGLSWRTLPPEGMSFDEFRNWKGAGR